MNLNNDSSVEWTEKVESNSNLRNPLGLWNHLNIQVDYVPGITSVTRRIRYYSLWSWYYEHIYEKKIIGQKDFERLFILTCLTHHNGDYKFAEFHNLHNKERFKDNWNTIESFKLNNNDFNISGQGFSYYNAQLTKLRCFWVDQLNQFHKSRINTIFSQPFPDVDEDFLKQKEFTKKDVQDHMVGFCICTKYPEEIDVMSKLLFGFINNKGNEWFIDQEEYTAFQNNVGINLDFKGHEVDTEEVQLTNAPAYKEMNQRRRNTLFMFLKIISETNPKRSDFQKTIYDALYFKQKTETTESIDFKGLNKVVQYWELLQLNVYYVYSLEKIFDVIQKVIYKENGIRKDNILSSLNESKLFKILSNLCKKNITNSLQIGDLIDSIYSNSSQNLGLKADINESIIYDNLSKTNVLEEMIVNSFVMLVLVKRRLETIDKEVIEESRIEQEILIEDKLRINKLIPYIQNNREMSFISFLDYLIRCLIERHLYESNVRMSWGTKNWLFVEEDSRLFFSKKDLIGIQTRDNRWNSILTLMGDIEMIKVDDKITLTDKGIKWLQLAKLI